MTGGGYHRFPRLASCKTPANRRLSPAARWALLDDRCAPVAQLDRASASEAEGCGFEPRRAHSLPPAQAAIREGFPLAILPLLRIVPGHAHTFRSRPNRRMAAAQPHRHVPAHPLPRLGRACAERPHARILHATRVGRTHPHRSHLGLAHGRRLPGHPGHLVR